MNDNEEPSFEDLLAAQPEQVKIDAGQYTTVLNTLPINPSEPFVIVAMDKDIAKHLKPYIVQLRGDQYMKWVVISAVHGIHKWGAGLWSDRFVFLPEVIEQIETLDEKDRLFIRALLTPAGMAEILRIRREDIKASLWERMRFRIKRFWKKLKQLFR